MNEKKIIKTVEKKTITSEKAVVSNGILKASSDKLLSDRRKKKTFQNRM